MSAPIKRFESTSWQVSMRPDSLGEYVLHSDHLASHAYDESVERAAFEADKKGYPLLRRPTGNKQGDGEYVNMLVETKWKGWKACAKSRAKRVGCE